MKGWSEKTTEINERVKGSGVEMTGILNILVGLSTLTGRTCCSLEAPESTPSAGLLQESLYGFISWGMLG